MPATKFEYGIQLKIVAPALIFFTLATSYLIYLSQTQGHFYLYLISILGVLFVLAILFALAVRLIKGKTFLIFENEYLEIPATPFKPKYIVYYKDIFEVGTESVQGSHFVQFKAKNYSKKFGLTNRLFKSETDFQQATDLLLKNTNKTFIY